MIKCRYCTWSTTATYTDEECPVCAHSLSLTKKKEGKKEDLEKSNKKYLKKFLILFFSFRGKIPRKSYWFSIISLMLILGVLVNLNSDNPLTFLVFPLIISLFAVQIKRCRDSGLSSWLVLLSLIPFISLLWYIVLGFKSSLKET